jgi:hypothetical protein
MQVNYHASNEYESVPNYKVLQQGFTAITLTRVSETAADPEGGQVQQQWQQQQQCAGTWSYFHCCTAS